MHLNLFPAAQTHAVIVRDREEPGGKYAFAEASIAMNTLIDFHKDLLHHVFCISVWRRTSQAVHVGEERTLVALHDLGKGRRVAPLA